MLVVRINVRNVAYIILAILLTSVREAYMGYGDSISNHAININSTPTYGSKKIELFGLCPAGTQCSELSVECLNCTLDFNCVYGSVYEAQCSVIDQVDCKGEIKFKKQYICRYCYQTEHWEHDCYLKNSCSSFASPQQYYRTNCTVKNDILCLGRRTFWKNLPCNWTGGYRWSTALILSITLGGFGADRFYLGHWQEGIGKLFSFGGLGVWTLIDVMLISMRYLGPADGSLYV
ncbi:TM2 domain-containing protein almondex isoform X1 [Copidosoma floridanum]|uniref:TM2 domain-containing protein almondex isoform X1 n=1 Tax=Copidosoma floridanum TaxID=29053 RepID=UPI0006C991C2|nr:TM2 domain-containing protein almondex isoform X1 [Copidosoma floridanum]